MIIIKNQDITALTFVLFVSFVVNLTLPFFIAAPPLGNFFLLNGVIYFFLIFLFAIIGA
jgi:hypothetical protein